MVSCVLKPDTAFYGIIVVLPTLGLSEKVCNLIMLLSTTPLLAKVVSYRSLMMKEIPEKIRNIDYK